jgi:hypothetical protein
MLLLSKKWEKSNKIFNKILVMLIGFVLIWAIYCELFLDYLSILNKIWIKYQHLLFYNYGMFAYVWSSLFVVRKSYLWTPKSATPTSAVQQPFWSFRQTNTGAYTTSIWQNVPSTNTIWLWISSNPSKKRHTNTFASRGIK